MFLTYATAYNIHLLKTIGIGAGSKSTQMIIYMREYFDTYDYDAIEVGMLRLLTLCMFIEDTYK